MSDHERILDHLRQAERILVALNGDAAAQSKLHSCKIHIWKAMDDLNEALHE